MVQPILGAKTDGTTGPPARMQKKYIRKVSDPGQIAKRAWKLLDADAPAKELNCAAKAVFEQNRSTLAVLNHKFNESKDRVEKMWIEKYLDTIQGTSDYMESLERAYARGPRESLKQEKKDILAEIARKLGKSGFPGFIEKHAVAPITGIITGGAVMKTEILVNAQLHLERLIGLFDKGLIGYSHSILGVSLGGIVAGSVALLAYARRKLLKKKRLDKIKEISKKEQTIKHAIVDLVVYEHERLATMNLIKAGQPIEEMKTIRNKMACTVYAIRKEFGFELPLPFEVAQQTRPILDYKPAPWHVRLFHYMHIHLANLLHLNEDNIPALMMHFMHKAADFRRRYYSAA